MQELRIVTGLAGLACLALAGGCQTMGGHGATASGVSPSFGQSYAAAQSEPPLEETRAGEKPAAAPPRSEIADESDLEIPPVAGKGRSRWFPGSEKEPPGRKALPVSSRTAAAADDDSLDL